MKIQCNCGQKYSFEVTPEMASNPIQFVCPQCGLDSSEVVNALVRQELGAADLPAPASAPPARPVVSAAPGVPAASMPSPPPSPPRPPGAGGALRVSAASPASAESGHASPAGAAAETRGCSRHPGESISHECVVCHKPMCPQCMRLTGLVCSPLCRSKAEAKGIVVPNYALQRDVVNRRRWRKVALVVGAIAAVLVAVFGSWFWYAWFGSVPKVVYAHRFAQPGYSGGFDLRANDQLVVLHGGTLSRHDLKAKSIVWSVDLIDRERIAKDSADELEQMKKAREDAIREGADRDAWRLPPLQDLIESNLRSAAAVFNLHVSAENVWLVTGEKATRYAWSDGRVDKELALDEGWGEPARVGEELVFSEASSWRLHPDPGTGTGAGAEAERSLRLDLATGDAKTTGPARLASASRALAAPKGRGRTASGGTAAPGNTNLAMKLAGTGRAAAGQPGGRPINPAAVARQVQNMPMPNRVALPATIAAAENQRRLQAAMNDDEDAPAIPRVAPTKPGSRAALEAVTRVKRDDGVTEFAVRLLERKIVQREAMKERPKKPALDGNVNAAATVDVANELLNEMQRDRAGSTVEEDESRYQVTVRGAGEPAGSWSGEVVGPPALHPLKSVDVVTAGKELTVLSRVNKKLWSGKLSYPVPGGLGGPDSSGSATAEPMADHDGSGSGRLSTGAGPVVEREGTLYVCDQGMLTCFALADGTVRWRLPSVGIAGLWFDDAGALYVNTTTGNPDSIRYSKQIDVTAKTHNRVLKVDAPSGRTLWTAEDEGHVTYLWKDFIYTVESNTGSDEEEAAMLGTSLGFEIPAHIRLRRLDAGNGRVRWEHYQKRFPLDVHFERNTIQLLFKREVQNLRFIVL